MNSYIQCVSNLLRITQKSLWEKQQLNPEMLIDLGTALSLDSERTWWSKLNLDDNKSIRCSNSEENKKQSHLQFLSGLLNIYILFQRTNRSCYVTVTNPALTKIHNILLTSSNLTEKQMRTENWSFPVLLSARVREWNSQS